MASDYGHIIKHKTFNVNKKHFTHLMALRGDRITELRKSIGMTQYDLAARLDVSQNVISRYERGTNNPTLETLLEMAALFETSTDYLLGRSHIPHPGAEPDPQPDLTEPERDMIALMRGHDLRTQRRLVKALEMLRAVWQDPTD